MLKLLKITISKRVVFKTDLARNLPVVRGQASQIRQLLMNLVTNASEAIGDREGVITMRTSVYKSKEDLPGSRATELPVGDSVQLEVSDTGRGMTEEETTKIFDPFFSTKSAGRGLGLAVVQGVVRSHGGAIWVDSVPDRGTTFRIFLPCSKRLEWQTNQPGVSAPAEQVSGLTRRVLFVEDEDILRQVVAKMLRTRGFLVIEAADGWRAINCLRDREQGIDAVLLDMTIPGSGSREVVKKCKEFGRR